MDVALNVEKKIVRKLRQKFRGKGPRGGGRESTAKSNEEKDGATSNQNTRGSGARRGRGFGRGTFVITCYRCRIEGHKASKRPKQVEEMRSEHRLPRLMRRRLLVAIWKYFSRSREKT